MAPEIFNIRSSACNKQVLQLTRRVALAKTDQVTGYVPQEKR